MDVGTPQSGQLRDPQPGSEQPPPTARAVEAADPTLSIGAGQQGIDLDAGEEADQGPLPSLVGQGQHPLDDRRVLRLTQRRT